MGPYIQFTQEQRDMAAKVDLEAFLCQRGTRLLPAGRDKRLACDHSVTIRGCEWYDHEEHRGGCAISFVQWFYHLSYPDAVIMLLGGEPGRGYPVDIVDRVGGPTQFVLPPAHCNSQRVFAYLTEQRCLSPEVVKHFIHTRMLYEDARYHNCVFVGTDEQGVPRHAHRRSINYEGKSFRQNVAGSDSRFSFHHVGRNERLYVFEAPIDMLSFITLYPKEWASHSYVACCGTTSVPVFTMLRRLPNVHEVMLCLDNDRAGELASLRMAEQIAEQFELAPSRLTSQNKDWNDDLCAQAREGGELLDTARMDDSGGSRGTAASDDLSDNIVSAIFPGSYQS